MVNLIELILYGWPSFVWRHNPNLRKEMLENGVELRSPGPRLNAMPTKPPLIFVDM